MTFPDPELTDAFRRLIPQPVRTAQAIDAAQKDGTVISRERQIYNFQGPGVTVSDDPSNRRTNVYIPGAPAASTSSTFISGAGNEKVFALGSIPANWYTNGFSDSGWASSVAESLSISAYFVVAPTAAWIVPTTLNGDNGASTVAFLARRTLTLPAGIIASATLDINVDDALGPTGGDDGTSLYINGHLLGALSRTVPTPRPYATIAIPIGWLTAGGSNVLAAHVISTGGAVALSYRLIVTMSGAGADTRYQLLSEKDAVSGYAGLSAGGLVASAELGTGTPTGSNFLRGDRTWAAASTNAVTVQEVDGTPSVSATVVQFPNGTLTDLGGGTVKYTASTLSGLSSAEAFLGADVTMTTVNTYYDGPTISLGVGTWLILASMEFTDTASAAHMTAKLWNGTTVLTSGQTIVVAASYGALMTLTGLRVIASGTEAWKMSGANGTNSTSGRIKAAALLNGAGNNATSIRAIQIA